jgi:hypothetical protein
MPRQPWLDAHDALHHVVLRWIAIAAAQAVVK